MSTPSKAALGLARNFSRYVGTDDPVYADTVACDLARQIDAAVAPLVEALEQTNAWIDSHVAYERPSHESPPEPANQFSYEAGSVLGSNYDVLAAWNECK